MSKFTRILVLCFAAFAVASASEPRIWQTLTGESPLVIARGGFSGVFPESSEEAYKYASRLSLPNMISWCNVQLTLDGVGLCLPELNLQNSTNIEFVYPNNRTSHFVNGVSTTGWFPSQFLLKDLKNVVNLTQGILSRSSDFNREFPVLTVDEVANIPVSPDSTETRALWLSFQNTAFYKAQGLSMDAFASHTSRSENLEYISSPELNFLRSYRHKFYKVNPNVKRILQFPEDASAVDSSTNTPYREYINDLRKLESVSGILVPASYIWPVDSESYLLPHTSLVSDAHELGISVFVYGISNDAPFAYDFNYDPIAANLAFVDNQNFSVDGILSEFPVTPSAAIDCFAHMGKDDPPQRNVTIISQEGASGVYPGCTDLAYDSAYDDGVDIIDCPVQMTKDGLPICLGSINLNGRTNVDQSPFAGLARVIPELGRDSGVFAFDLTWDQIQELKPEIFNWAQIFGLDLNPKFKNAGKFMPLWVLLQNIITRRETTTKNVKGLLISIENADYLSTNLGMDVTRAVLDTLQSSAIHRMSDFNIMFHSSDKSVLIKVKDSKKYECVYENDDDLKDASDSKISEVKQFADSLIVGKNLEYPLNVNYLTGETKIIQKIKRRWFPSLCVIISQRVYI